jgi:ABC-2 type transport system ATP-binding protein
VILVSTHQVRDMENMIDPIIILDDGRIIFQQPLEEAARRLSTGMEREEPRGDGVLYTEKTLGGWMVVRERAAGDGESGMDIETLFNAVTTNREKVQAIFAGSGQGRAGTAGATGAAKGAL